MSLERATVVCMTPVKNEEWIMKRFLEAASLWADVIVVADQGSTDRTTEICRSFSKVKLIQNTSEKFNEEGRQDLLIRSAREIPGKRLLIALDADEFLTGNFEREPEWNEMLTAEPGTVFEMKWPCITSDYQNYWMTEGASNLFAVMDDGCPHHGREMHSIRVPISKHAVTRRLETLEVMHFQYTDWNRMKCKNLWYQCYERIHHPEKSAASIYRMYHHMDVRRTLQKIPESWLEAYESAGIHLDEQEEITKEYWWTKEIHDFIEQYGENFFQYIDFPQNQNALLGYLRKTQCLWKYRYGRALLRRVDPLAERCLQKGNEKRA